MKDVDLFIKSVHEIPDGEPLKSELFTTGTLAEKNGKLVLHYADDPAGHAGDGNYTEIVVWGERAVVLKSRGKLEYTFHLTEGRSYQTDLNMEGMYAAISLTAQEVCQNLTPRGGRIHMVYRMSAEGHTLSVNTVDITVTLPKKQVRLKAMPDRPVDPPQPENQMNPKGRSHP